MEVHKTEALAESGTLARIQHGLRGLAVPPVERGDLQSYRTALTDERALDKRIAVDVDAADEGDVNTALEQHAFNSEERTTWAQKLGITCLVQSDLR
jgi:hypothetical protein